MPEGSDPETGSFFRKVWEGLKNKPPQRPPFPKPGEPSPIADIRFPGEVYRSPVDQVKQAYLNPDNQEPGLERFLKGPVFEQVAQDVIIDLGKRGLVGDLIIFQSTGRTNLDTAMAQLSRIVYEHTRTDDLRSADRLNPNDPIQQMRVLLTAPAKNEARVASEEILEIANSLGMKLDVGITDIRAGDNLETVTERALQAVQEAEKKGGNQIVFPEDLQEKAG